MIFRTVSARLTGGYVLISAGFALAFALGIYLLISGGLMRRTDTGLVASGDVLVGSLAQERHAGQTNGGELDRLIAGELPEIVMEDAARVETVAGKVVSQTARGKQRWILRAMDHLRESGTAVPNRLTVGRGTDRARVHARAFVLGGRPYTLFLARSLADQDELLESLRESLMIGIPLWILVTGCLGYWLLRRTLAPVGTMSREAAAIGAEDLTRRLPVLDSRDEFGQLATTLNALLDRLERAIAQQRRFMADASHELRTPVSIVRGEAEVTLATDENDPAMLRDALGVIARESRSVSEIVEDLFLLARADSGQRVLSPSRFYLDELLDDVVRSMRSLAARKQLDLETDLARECMIEADEALVRRLLFNLLQNSVKYSVNGGSVKVLLIRTSTTDYSIEVSDSGPGIPAEEWTRIFDRFYRGPRAGTESGSGLGLSIARSIAELHGGSLQVADSTSSGSTFRVVLPREQPRGTTHQAAR